MSQPFLKRQSNDYQAYEIRDTTISFVVPVLHKVPSIKRIEFISAPNSESDREGGLFIQTERQIFFSNNLTGKYTELTTAGHM